jgi:hypothetical protein
MLRVCVKSDTAPESGDRKNVDIDAVLDLIKHAADP